MLALSCMSVCHRWPLWTVIFAGQVLGPCHACCAKLSPTFLPSGQSLSAGLPAFVWMMRMHTELPGREQQVQTCTWLFSDWRGACTTPSISVYPQPTLFRTDWKHHPGTWIAAMRERPAFSEPLTEQNYSLVTHGFVVVCFYLFLSFSSLTMFPLLVALPRFFILISPFPNNSSFNLFFFSVQGALLVA